MAWLAPMNDDGSHFDRWKLNQSLFWVKQEGLEFFSVLSSGRALQELLCSFLEDGRMPHTRTLLQITAYWLSTSSWVLFAWAEAHASFCLAWAQAFSLTPFYPSFISAYFFVTLQFLVPSLSLLPSHFLIYILCNRWVPSPHPELLHYLPTPQNFLTQFRFCSSLSQKVLKLESIFITFITEVYNLSLVVQLPVNHVSIHSY